MSGLSSPKYREMRTFCGPSTLAHWVIRCGVLVVAASVTTTVVFGCAQIIATAEKWQTLIAGVLAIAAAGVGGWFVYQQTLQQDAHERERCRGRFAAARAMLPLTLTSICEYSVSCGMQVKGVMDAWQSQQQFPHGYAFDIPSVPVEITDNLRLFIAASDDIVGQYAARIIVMMQIQAARCRDLARELRWSGPTRMIYARHSLARLAADFAELCVVSEAFSPFARKRSETPPADQPFTGLRLTVALESFGLDPNAHQEAFVAADDSADGKSGLWNSLVRPGVLM